MKDLHNVKGHVLVNVQTDLLCVANFSDVYKKVKAFVYLIVNIQKRKWFLSGLCVIMVNT